MAGDETRMDLNLYLGLPPLPRHPNRDLGSDLTLSPGMWGGFEQPSFQRNYSPSNALCTPELLPMDPLRAAEDSPASEHIPHLPSLEATVGPYGFPRLLETPETHASDARYSPPYVRASAGPDQAFSLHTLSSRIPRRHNEAAAAAASAAALIPYSTVRMGDLLARGDRLSLQQDLLECPELRFQRLIESNNRFRIGRLLLPGTYDGERSDSQTSPDQLMHDIMRSQRTLEASKKDKLRAQGKGAEGLEKEEDESAANFECNICFEMAKEPVVTPCGHLFCWPCLYRWLHGHSVYSECPVCKGEVLEVNMTPIYGRGGSNTSAKDASGEGGEPRLKIPPRPHARRTESLRQEFQRPVSRRLGDESATSWRHIIDEEVQNVVTLEEYRGSSSRFTFDGAHRALITRLRQWRMQREEGSGSNIVGVELPVNSERNLQINPANSVFRDGMDHSQQPRFEHASTSRLSRLLQRSFAGGASPSVNPHSPEPLHHRPPVQSTPTTEQASASSTMAVIQGPVSATEISAEPNRAGSSRSLRRRRSSTSGSLDVDGGAFHSRRRRRLN